MKHRAAHEAYLELLYASDISLTAIAREDAWERHIEESLEAVPLLESGVGTVVDVGSGGGAPGIPLAIEMPIRATLVEAAAPKAAFLRAAVSALGLRADVWHQRSEEATRGPGRDAFDAAVARALAPPPVALELVLPFVRPGGTAILWTGDVDRSALADAAGQLSAVVDRVVQSAAGRNLVVLRKTDRTPDRFPRRPGMARKRPLASLRSPA